MSIRIMSSIWDRGPEDRGELLVLLALADFANDTGECWPSVASIAQKARMEERSVRRILRKLEDAGWLSSDIGGGRHGCNRYIVNPDAVSPGRNVPPDTDDTKPGLPCPPNRQEPSTVLRKDAREGFADFWEQWPNKVGKDKAEKAWRKLKIEDKRLAYRALIGGWFDRWRGQNPTASPIMAATFINQKRWEDSQQADFLSSNGVRYDIRPRNSHNATGGPSNRPDPALAQIARLAGLGQTPGDGGFGT